jgi:hypothetical protein
MGKQYYRDNKDIEIEEIKLDQKIEKIEIISNKPKSVDIKAIPKQDFSIYEIKEYIRILKGRGIMDTEKQVDAIKEIYPNFTFQNVKKFSPTVGIKSLTYNGIDIDINN